jgi:hypothetical protein
MTHDYQRHPFANAQGGLDGVHDHGPPTKRVKQFRQTGAHA